MTPKQFPLERILNISVSEYCEIMNARLSDYIPIGVHANACNNWSDPIEYFADYVPKDAEVVVSYMVQRSLGPYEDAKPGASARGVQFTASGTALVPKTSRKIK